MEQHALDPDKLEVKEYAFKNFQDRIIKIDDAKKLPAKDFHFQKFQDSHQNDGGKHQEKIKSERALSEKSGFSISTIVQKHRGIQKQAHEEREQKIEEEVQHRFNKVRDEAYEVGHAEGVKKGQESVFEEMKSLVEEKLSILTEMINSVLTTKEDILAQQKKEIYHLVRSLTKWVILRELKDDGQYIGRLLEKLVAELQTKNHLLIQVSEENFEGMTEVLEIVQKNIGALPHVRLEIHHEMKGTGIILSSDHGIIDGTLEQQFQSLDKLFETVGIKDESASEQPS